MNEKIKQLFRKIRRGDLNFATGVNEWVMTERKFKSTTHNEAKMPAILSF
ncbi:hypothetical protein CAMSH0001_1077 [Campylobacter showae RM3277]|uniref:Uncharacterized protein n=1 Tax=Campylobacter showae RM3277 TaxID=553219 RepID=C6RHW6_9BACT|nr:hypothetical protein CAMSH0001_1077 [Campylobacter showae RM3277]